MCYIVEFGLTETDKLLSAASKKNLLKKHTGHHGLDSRYGKINTEFFLSSPYPLKLKILLFPSSYLSNYIAFGQRHKNYRVGKNMGTF